jgi:acyl-CoA reductase-like NAD-dependent aldehyde dehydrogenase
MPYTGDVRPAEESFPQAPIDVLNPATGELLGTVPDASSEGVDRAVAAARACFENRSWRGLDPSRRERILWNIGELLLKHQDELAKTISLENGKTLREAAGADVAPAADCFRYYAGWVRKIYGRTIPVDGPYLNYTLREPVGVVGAIVPWNFPLQIAAWKVAPALACGCSVVLKPSELTPLHALKLAGICTQAGLPEGAPSTWSPAMAKPPAKRWRCTKTSIRSASPAASKRRASWRSLLPSRTSSG